MWFFNAYPRNDINIDFCLRGGANAPQADSQLLEYYTLFSDGPELKSRLSAALEICGRIESYDVACAVATLM